jgi:hypothetical protein
MGSNLWSSSLGSAPTSLHPWAAVDGYQLPTLSVSTKAYNTLDVQMGHHIELPQLCLFWANAVNTWALCFVCVCINTQNRGLKYSHSSAAVCVGNMFQDLLRLSETVDHTEHNIMCYSCNIHKYDKINWQIRAFLTHCHNVATNVNIKNARSRIEASSVGKRGYRHKGR